MTFDLSRLQKDENGHLIAQTRGGWRVRILCTDLKDIYPIVGIVERLDDATGLVRTWRAAGRWGDDGANRDMDLITPPITHVVTVFRYEYRGVWICDAWGGDVPWAQIAGPNFTPGPSASRKVITITEGEGS